MPEAKGCDHTRLLNISQESYMKGVRLKKAQIYHIAGIIDEAFILTN